MTTSQEFFLSPLDANNSKIYILGKILLKSISEFWYEEYQEIVNISGDELLTFLMGSHSYKFLNVCFWVDAPFKPTNVVGTQTVGVLK